ncbi:MAG: hypothetical protein PHT80_04845 [Lentisphaeria bacterium]|nr:hypothetical protein [Lentisphaeria bacterium]
MTQTEHSTCGTCQPRINRFSIGIGTRILIGLLLAGFIFQTFAGEWTAAKLALRPDRLPVHLYTLWTAALLPSRSITRMLFHLLAVAVFFRMIEQDLTRRGFALFWLVVAGVGSAAAAVLAPSTVTTVYGPIAGVFGALWHLQRQNSWSIFFAVLPARTILAIFWGLTALQYILSGQWHCLAAITAAALAGYAFMRFNDAIAFRRRPAANTAKKHHLELD